MNVGELEWVKVGSRRLLRVRSLLRLLGEFRDVGTWDIADD
jgi:hypothetical protein